MTLPYLIETKFMYVQAIQGLNASQWNFRPAPEVWSIAGCAEHIAISEEHILGLVRKLEAGPEASVEEIAQTEGKGELILRIVSGRRGKASAPKIMSPTNAWPTPEGLIAHFTEIRDRTIELAGCLASSLDAGLRNRIAPHFALGPLSGEQWLLFIAAHSERHVKQINELKSHPGYPTSVTA